MVFILTRRLSSEIRLANNRSLTRCEGEEHNVYCLHNIRAILTGQIFGLNIIVFSIPRASA